MNMHINKALAIKNLEHVLRPAIGTGSIVRVGLYNGIVPTQAQLLALTQTDRRNLLTSGNIDNALAYGINPNLVVVDTLDQDIGDYSVPDGITITLPDTRYSLLDTVTWLSVYVENPNGIDIGAVFSMGAVGSGADLEVVVPGADSVKFDTITLSGFYSTEYI